LFDKGLKVSVEKVKLFKKLTARSRMTVATSIAHFVNDVPLTLPAAVILILREEFDLSYAALGGIITASAFFMTSLQFVTGYVADRWNRTTLLFGGLTMLGVGTILMGFSTNYVQLLAFGCLMGIGGSVFHPIGYSLLSDAFEPGNRGKALGLGSAAGDIAVPVAFATSGFLAPVLGWRSLFILWGLIAIIIAVILPSIMKEPRKKGFHSNATSNSTKTIVRTLIPVFIAMGLAAASYKIASSFITTYLNDFFELNLESANFILALMMVVGTFGSIVGGNLVDKFGEKNTVTAEMVMLGVLSIVSVYISNVYFLSGIICILGFFMLGVWPSFYSVIAGSTTLGARAFMYGILFAVSWSFGSFFPYISGACADIFGLQVIYILIGVLSLLAAFVAYFTFKK
jgi:FSR family fosmidomycin resistance protein-like MFS transporter